MLTVIIMSHFIGPGHLRLCPRVCHDARYAPFARFTLAEKTSLSKGKNLQRYPYGPIMTLWGGHGWVGLILAALSMIFGGFGAYYTYAAYQRDHGTQAQRVTDTERGYQPRASHSRSVWTNGTFTISALCVFVAGVLLITQSGSPPAQSPGITSPSNGQSSSPSAGFAMAYQNTQVVVRTLQNSGCNFGETVKH